MPDIKHLIEERDINPYHSFLSSFFAGLAEMGMINQGSMNIVSKRAAQYMYGYFEAKDLLDAIDTPARELDENSIRSYIDFVNQQLELVGNYQILKESDGQYIFQIAANSCRICPKGVGGAAIKGTFCPIPSFFKHLVNLLLGEELLSLQSSGINKVEGNCRAVFILD